MTPTERIIFTLAVVEFLTCVFFLAYIVHKYGYTAGILACLATLTGSAAQTFRISLENGNNNETI